MNNFIEYFYNIKVDNIQNNRYYYSFIYNGYIYKLYIYDNNKNVNQIVNINKHMLGRTLVSEIILNKENNPISIYNGIPYILIKLYVSFNKNISLEEISYLSNSLYTTNININYGLLWSRKIDYLEELINENGKKYPLLVDSFNYFVGLAENAIAYYNNINIGNKYRYFISHKSIRYTDNDEALYNPLNIIFDYKVRDLAEYIKNAFFLNNKNIYNEIYTYLNHNELTLTDIKILIARLLYPSFYFELYEDILINNESEKIIVNYIDKLPEYEKYLASIISFLKKFYQVDEILWLKRN